MTSRAHTINHHNDFPDRFDWDIFVTAIQETVNARVEYFINYVEYFINYVH